MTHTAQAAAAPAHAETAVSTISYEEREAVAAISETVAAPVQTEPPWLSLDMPEGGCFFCWAAERDAEVRGLRGGAA